MYSGLKELHDIIWSSIGICFAQSYNGDDNTISETIQRCIAPSYLPPLQPNIFQIIVNFSILAQTSKETPGEKENTNVRAAKGKNQDSFGREKVGEETTNGLNQSPAVEMLTWHLPPAPRSRSEPTDILSQGSSYLQLTTVCATKEDKSDPLSTVQMGNSLGLAKLN